MEPNFFFFILVGFVAQLIDGALGMAYGVSSASLLLSIGISPAAASASVHAAEVFTTAASGLSHLKFGNADKGSVIRLMISGILGGVIGVFAVINIPESVIRPIISVYLILMAILIFRRVFTKNKEYRHVTTHLIPLGVVGGFFDAIGGGGWGPIVTSTLLARGNWPRKTIGSVNTAEFGVALVQTMVFFVTIGLVHWQITVGLIIGGVIASPLAALMLRYIPIHHLVNFVGFVVALLGVRMMYLVFAR